VALFRSSAQPPPPLADRIAALGAASASELGVLACAHGEPPALRAAAIALLPDGAILRQLAGLAGDAGAGSASDTAGAEVQAQARARLAALVDAGMLEIAALHGDAVDPAAVLAVADACSDPAQLERALSAPGDPALLERLVLAGPSLRIRQQAAQRIEGREELNRLLRALQGKDKSVYRILKDKRDAIRAEARQATQRDTEIRAVSASLESLAAHPHDPLFEPAYQHFAARWTALEAQAQPWIRERTRAALARCRAVIDAERQRRAEQAALAARERELEQQRGAERAAAEAEAAAEQLRRAAAATEAEAAAAHAAAELAQQQAERAAAETRVLDQLAALLARAHGALRGGRSGPAAGMRRALGEKLATAPALPPALARSLADLDARLGALREWKDYAVAPKRAELIAQMEALVGAGEPPAKLAARIRELRAQWKTISQGVITDADADWQRFNQAATQAYEPCRVHFEEQARERAANLERRRQLLDRLVKFEASQQGEHPDWRAIGAALREAPAEWRLLGPVDRETFKAIQAEFTAVVERLRARLAGWQAANSAAKAALAQRAQALLDHEDNRAAMDEVKSLQRQWQEIGPAERARERKLWEEFRGHCDAVFRKRDTLAAERSAGLQDNRARAVALCEALEALAAGSGAALLANPKNAPEWRAEFDAIGELPRADEQGLRRRFEQALKHCANLAARHRASERAQAWDRLLEAARRIHGHGWATAQGEDPAAREALRQEAEAFVAETAAWPKGGEAALAQAWQASADAGANEAALRLLCVRGEIHGERATPDEDQALRRSYQLQRLVKGMGRGEQEPAGDWESLALEWVRVGPVAPELYQALLARFIGIRARSSER
jgi:hypothetical protein